ncbi:tetraspanin-19 isoform X2 [Ricinus communis]|uniref:tetraspanin-19 isoform X2 n=1 Tax=Ricinus communis TaxID=3988 RepID=UPI0007725886|nr:tetraspanin-19 isoform X2 [Ricinus communis]|eukprot:XP_015574608.1 tetraspanin-19 isoform X2 [Ricinus communis]
MASVAKTLLRSILKMLNSVMAIVGIAMILYGLWMVRVWQRDMEESSSSDTYDSSALWFIYTFLSIGIALCLITCLGHISADSSNGFCLSCYTVIISMILLVELAVGADILLNSDWEKDLPEDPTGRFHDFKEFVKSNFDVFKWIGLLIVLAQGSSILLAMALRATGLNYEPNYDSDDEYPPGRLPLINHHLQPSPYGVGDPGLASKNDAWKTDK